MNDLLYTNVSDTDNSEQICYSIGIWFIDRMSEDLYVTYCSGTDKQARTSNIGKPLFDVIRVSKGVKERIYAEVNRTNIGSAVFVDREGNIYVLGLMSDSFKELCLIKTDKRVNKGKRTTAKASPFPIFVPLGCDCLEALDIPSNDKQELENICNCLAVSSNCLCATAVNGSTAYSAFCECLTEFAKLSGGICIFEEDTSGDTERSCDRETPNYSVCDKVAKLFLMLQSKEKKDKLYVKKENNAIILTHIGHKLTDDEASLIEGYMYSGAMTYCQNEVTGHDPATARFELYPESQYRDGVKHESAFVADGTPSE